LCCSGLRVSVVTAKAQLQSLVQELLHSVDMAKKGGVEGKRGRGEETIVTDYLIHLDIWKKYC